MIKKLTFVLLLLSFFVSGCVTTTMPAPQPRPIARQEKIYLNDLCERHNLTCTWDSMSQVVTIVHGREQARGMINSKTVYWNQQKIFLDEPIALLNSSILVPRDFNKKIIERIRAPDKERQEYSIQTIQEVIIDAGHGGKDPGAIGTTGIYEKKVALDIAKRLQKILKRHGIKTKLTRSNDTFISLKDRTIIASKSKADLFISVHANAHAQSHVHGVEVYTLKGLNRLEKNEVQRKDNHKTLFKHLSMKRKDEDLNNIISDMLYAHKQAMSTDLAGRVAKKTSAFINSKNLGSKQSRFFVLRNTLIPAILVEVGFLTNSKEEKRLKTKAYRQKVAFALAKSILDYTNEK